MFCPLWVMAQYWESGTVKTNNFFNYTSGGNTYSKTEVSYRINAEQDGKMEFFANPLGDVRITGIGLYAVEDDELLYVANGAQTLSVEDVAAGLYEVKFFGQPTDKGGQGGNFQAGYVLTPADYVNDPEPNNTWERAYQIESGNPQHGHLGYKRAGSTDTEDCFMIVVPDEGTVTFTTRTSTKLLLGYLGMYTMKDDGTGVNYRNDKWMSGEGKDTTIVYTVPDLAPGTYYVKVSRYSGYGSYKMTYTFVANNYGADDRDNDTWDKAKDMALDTPTDGRLGYYFNGDTDGADWYKIVVPEEGKLTFTTKTDPTLFLGYVGMYTTKADGTGTEFRNDKWMSGEGKNTTVVYEVPDVSIGTYYVRVQRYSGYGGYRLTCYFTSHAAEADPEPNDTWQEAMPLKSGPAITGQLGYTYNGDTDTEDWYKIEVEKEGSVVFTTKTETTLRLGYLGMYTPKADGTGTDYRNDKWMSGDGKDTTLVYTVPDCKPGTYYVRIQRYSGYGGYKLDYTFTPNSLRADYADNGTWDKGTIIESNTTQQGRLGYHYNGDTDGEDWFKIELPEEGKVTFATTTDPTLRLGYVGMYTPKADGTGTNYRNDKWMSSDGKDTTVVYEVPDCKPGTYYVRVARYSGYGGYNLDYTFTPNVYGADVAANDSIQGATTIETGVTQQGRLGYHYNSDTDGIDWYVIDVPYVGDVTFTVKSETTLRLGYLGLYLPKEDGTGTDYRCDKWMSGDGKDTTITYSINGLGAGKYYVRVSRNNGYGGYAMKYDYEHNPYDRDNLQNYSFAQRTTLEEGRTVSTTMGYRYRTQNNEDWYDLGLMHGRQIDVTIAPDTTHTLVIGVPALYIYKGDKEDGSPDLQKVAESRIERSQGTISYIDKNDEDQHYVFRVPNYSGSSYGGYTITFGDEHKEGEMELAGATINVLTEGRNTVRKGVPCENPITITNTSNVKTGKFLVTIATTDNIDIIGFRMPGRQSRDYLPLDSVTVLDEGTCQHTAVFLVPSLNPWESYTFTMISEGKGDIAYVREETEFSTGRNKIAVNSTTFAIVAVMGNVEGADSHINVDDYIVHRISDVYDLTGEQRLKLSQLIGQLDTEKQQTGKATFSVLSLLKRASELCGMDLLDATCPIASSLRQRILQWVYLDEQYVLDEIDILDGKAAITDVVASWDPNEMVGPAGVGEDHYIGQTQTVNYRILFENKAEAGDAAYRVRISDELDENVFDVSTVRFGETSHDGVGYNWEMTRDGNKLSWDIKGIELPPNVNAPEGEGYVSFSVDLKPGLADGTQIRNKATIIFDKNFPIETNEFVNTLDLLPPTTMMAEATYTPGNDHVNILCNSDDTGSGVESYLLFVSKNGSEYSYAGQSVTGDILFPVNPTDEDTYSFYVLAIDNVGNTEHMVPQTVGVTTDVRGVTIAGNPNAVLRVYTPDGRYVGNSLQGLQRGIYLIGGRKVVIK